jgi:hypothetical protein
MLADNAGFYLDLNSRDSQARSRTDGRLDPEPVATSWMKNRTLFRAYINTSIPLGRITLSSASAGPEAAASPPSGFDTKFDDVCGWRANTP